MIGSDLTAVKKAVNLLKDKGFTEFYIFERVGIPTTYIGEYKGLQPLVDFTKKNKFNTGNMVVF